MSGLAAFPALSVKVIVHVYVPSPFDALRVTVCVPDDDSVAVESSPQPVVPPTEIVPASLVDITTSGVASLVGVVTAVLSLGADTAVSRVKAVSVSGLAAFPAVSVKVIVHVYVPSPFDALRVTVCVPDDDSVAVESSAQPVVPPTEIMPASLVDIATSGVASLVGVVTAVLSLGADTAVSRVKAVNVSGLAAFPEVSVKVIVHVYVP